MIRQIQYAIMAISIVAIAITTSCYTDLENDFQQLESTDSTPVKLVDVTDANNPSDNKIYADRMVAQKLSIPANKSYLLQGAQIKLRRVGNFDGIINPEVQIRLYTDKPGEPFEWSVYSTNADVTTIIETEPSGTGEYVPFEFSLQSTLNGGTTGKTYWIVLKFVNAAHGNDANYIQFYDDDDDTSSQSIQYDDGTNPWSPEDGNMGIVIWGRPVN